jgi:dephospho-CoA kinase
MLLVGLTGNIASGKSTVAEILVGKGVTLIDADVLARDAVAVGTAGLTAVLQRFGNTVRAPDGSLDRAALRALVFANAGERDALNAIVHPRVEEMRAAAVADAKVRGDQIVVCDIPLLYENDLGGDFDCVVLVDAPRPVRLQRLVRERGIEAREAQAMIDAQMPSSTKRIKADFVIDNDGSHAQLERRTLEVWRTLVRDAERQNTN